MSFFPEGCLESYSSPPLSAAEVSQDPQWMSEAVGSTEPCICTHIPFSLKEALYSFCLASLNC